MAVMPCVVIRQESLSAVSNEVACHGRTYNHDPLYHSPWESLHFCHASRRKHLLPRACVCAWFSVTAMCVSALRSSGRLGTHFCIRSWHGKPTSSRGPTRPCLASLWLTRGVRA